MNTRDARACGILPGSLHYRYKAKKEDILIDMTCVLLFEWRSLCGDSAGEIVAERDRYERIWAAMLDAMKVKGFIRQDVDIEVMRLIGLGAKYHAEALRL